MFKFFLLPMLMSFGFFRLLPQSEDLICNGVVVLMVRCFFNEFLLQLIHAFLNGRWGGCIFGIGTGNAVVSENFCKKPAGMIRYIFLIMRNLSFIT